VAEDQGFIEAAQDAPYEIIPDYVLPGVPDEAVATIGAGVVGTLIVAGIAFAAARVRRRATS
jgi:cobalt/nickel transport system permease protein